MDPRLSHKGTISSLRIKIIESPFGSEIRDTFITYCCQRQYQYLSHIIRTQLWKTLCRIPNMEMQLRPKIIQSSSQYTAHFRMAFYYHCNTLYSQKNKLQHNLNTCITLSKVTECQETHLLNELHNL